jgi:hypothetical protein
MRMKSILSILLVVALCVGPTSVALSTIPESAVTGLVSDLDARAVIGPGYVNSRTAIINDTGQIEGAVGSLSNCVHVDGSSGPCSAPNFSDGEIPSGIINGVNVSFTVVHAPNPASSLKVYRNGIRQELGLDYTLSGNALTFSSGSVPQSSSGLDLLLVDYRF